MSYRVSYVGSDGVYRTTRTMNARRTADEFATSYRKLMQAKGREPHYEIQRRWRGAWQLVNG